MGQRTIGSRIHQRILIAFLSFILSVLAGGANFAKEPTPAFTHHPAFELLKKLENRADVNLEAVPLTEAIEELRRLYKLPLILDTVALDNCGIDRESLVSLKAKNIQAWSALDVILSDLDLTIVPHEPWLQITSLEEAETRLTVVHYPVWDLLKSQDSEDVADADYDSLIELITTSVKPETWEEVGGTGTITGYNGILAFSQMAEVHRIASQLIDGLRMLPPSQDATIDTPPKAVFAEPKWKAALRKKLKTKVNLKYEDVSLRTVIDELAMKLKIPMLVDTNALESFGIDPEGPVNCKLDVAELGLSLAMLLRQRDLTFVLKNEQVVVTSIEEAEAEREFRVYPVVGLLDGSDRRFADYDRLIELICRTIGPESWEEVGGTGSIAAFPNRKCLVIAQRHEVHEAIEPALLDLFEKLQDPNGGPRPTVATKPEDIVTYVYRVPTGISEPVKSEASPGESSTSMTLNKKDVLAQFGGGSGGGFRCGFGGCDLGGLALKPIDSQTLSHLIAATTAKGTWGVKDAKIIVVPDRLYIRCRHDVHQKIQKLFDDLSVQVLNPYGESFDDGYGPRGWGCHMGNEAPSGGGGVFNVDDGR